MGAPSGLASEARRVEGDWWRVVEAQHRNSTLALVDEASLADQAILEAEIETVKPTIPATAARLHYLLFPPYRSRPGDPHNRRPTGRTRVWQYVLNSVVAASLK